jgi:DNA sulfur modification protein DndC
MAAGGTDEALRLPRQGYVLTVIKEIQEAYLNDARPWVIGFSGGKDSTALLQFVYHAIRALPPESRHKHIYVLASDTRVEAPRISARIKGEISRIQASAELDGLPLSAHVVFPKLNDSFWVNLIGRGYPSPTSKFRWCTDRLKIYPISEFIKRVINRSGEVVVVLGARRDESATRAQALKRNEVEGARFRPHQDLVRAYVYTPIVDLTTNEVWAYLLQVPSPWGSENRELVSLYKQAGGGECPLVIDTTTPSCGNSRFGCWTCTVVERDRSMESLVESGEDSYTALLELRDWLKELRNEPGSRYDRRRNGSVPKNRHSGEEMTNTGPYTHETRYEILRRVLKAQTESGIMLIEPDELLAIQQAWNSEELEHGWRPDVPADKVQQIWKRATENDMSADRNGYDHLSSEDALLREVCEEQGVPFEMMRRLRDLEDQYNHLKRRAGLPDDMREVVRGAVLSAPGQESDPSEESDER